MNHEVLVLGARSLYELFNECMHRMIGHGRHALVLDSFVMKLLSLGF